MTGETERKILKALTGADFFNTIRELAMASGFKGVQDTGFKEALNHLLELGKIMPYQVGFIDDEGDMKPMVIKRKLSELNGRIQIYWKQGKCVDCEVARLEEANIYCQKYGWNISKELAMLQQLCVF